jgi:hypothetical protein
MSKLEAKNINLNQIILAFAFLFKKCENSLIFIRVYFISYDAGQ